MNNDNIIKITVDMTLNLVLNETHIAISASKNQHHYMNIYIKYCIYYGTSKVLYTEYDNSCLHYNVSNKLILKPVLCIII